MFLFAFYGVDVVVVLVEDLLLFTSFVMAVMVRVLILNLIIITPLIDIALGKGIRGELLGKVLILPNPQRKCLLVTLALQTGCLRPILG